MPLVDLARSTSVWRGMEIYKSGKVLSWEKVEEGIFDGIVAGSNGEKYKVHTDTVHPRKSTCNCPLANGKRIICKHILAISFCVDDSEAERFKSELTVYKSEEEERRDKNFNKYYDWGMHMQKRALAEAYAYAMVELEELKRTKGNDHRK